MRYKYFIIFVFLVASGVVFLKVNSHSNKESHYHIGQVIDSLNGVYVYYNGPMSHVSGRNLTPDNYNLGLKYQCVEFAKRYYYEHYNHKMPDAYGDAKDFYKKSVGDGEENKSRNLLQYKNPSIAKPAVGDLVVFNGTSYNKYGHVAIISDVRKYRIEVIQQNKSKSRESFFMIKRKGKWHIMNKRILGWLRMKV
jgi:surface antigen